MYRMICFTTQCDTMCNIVQCTEWYVSQHSVILCVMCNIVQCTEWYVSQHSVILCVI